MSATFLILLVASIVVTSKQHVGDPIDCLPGRTSHRISQDLMDAYCWVHSTFTILNQRDEGWVLKPELNHLGPLGKKSNIKYHRYYQWVPFVLFFQALCFYAPRYLWKSWEGQKMKDLSADLNGTFVDPSIRDARKQRIIDYLTCYLRNTSEYSYRYFFCEILNLVNIVTQIFLTDKFLNNDFLTYGMRVVSLGSSLPDDYRYDDVLANIFPTTAACQYFFFGPSGTDIFVGGLCLLSVNVTHQKIYLFLFFWFLALAVVSALGVLYRICTIFSRPLRLFMLRRKAAFNSKRHIERIVNTCNVGDWLVLMLLGDNLNSSVYKEIVKEFSDYFKHKEAIDV